LQDVIFGFGRNCSPIEENVILCFYNIFIKTNSPSTSNRNSRIFKSELYHASQQLSHDCSIRIFSHKYKYMYIEQTLCKLNLKHVMDMSLLSVVHRSIVHQEGIAGIKLSLFLVIKIYVCSKLKIGGS
jgi:hypothetical protein